MAPVESTTCSRLPSPSRAQQEQHFAGQGECSDYGLDEAVNRLLPYSYNARLLIFLCAPLCAPGYPETPTDTHGQGWDTFFSGRRELVQERTI